MKKIPRNLIYEIKGVIYLTLLSLLVLSCSRDNVSPQEDGGLKALFEEIDEEISKSSVYQQEKEERINLLKDEFRETTDPMISARLCDRLIDEYESFNSDSALFYVDEALKQAQKSQDRKKEVSLLIRKADIAAHAGLFSESGSILSSIDSSKLEEDQKEEYYSAYCDLYQYRSEYTAGELGRQSEILREQYIDSISTVSLPSSVHYVINKAAASAREGDYEKAEKMLTQAIGRYESGERNYSILTSILADVNRTKGNDELYKHYLALSVISDIKGSIKENMAIRALATACYEDGDIERADRYLRQSFADANFFSARMRNSQSSRMLPIIGEAYNQYQNAMHKKLRGFVIAVSILAGILAIFICFVVKQFFIVKKANKRSNRMLEEVSVLSEKLKSMNEEVVFANEELKNSNRIKEEYAAMFMEYCSMAISTLQQYHQSLRVLAAQGNLKTLMKKIDSTEMEEKNLKDFYQKFDEAILHIYPDFVEKFNRLLEPEYKIVLKPNEALNTELRVFALIRIGITDSEKIAGFLRCSLSTIYTYRSKIKKRAINPDEFENQVRNI